MNNKSFKNGFINEIAAVIASKHNGGNPFLDPEN